MTIKNIYADIINELLKVSDYEVICAVNNPIKYKDYLKHERLNFIASMKESFQLFKLNSCDFKEGSVL